MRSSHFSTETISNYKNKVRRYYYLIRSRDVQVISSDCVFCCSWDAKKRMTPDEALRHEWLKTPPTAQTEVRRSPSSVNQAAYRVYRGSKPSKQEPGLDDSGTFLPPILWDQPQQHTPRVNWSHETIDCASPRARR